MNLNTINSLLSNVKLKLESLDPANLAEQEDASYMNSKKINGAKKRLAGLYQKLTKDRPDSTKVKAYGARR